MPGIVTYSMPCHKVVKPTELAFFSELCVAANFLLALDETARVMRRSLVQFIVGEVRNSGQNRVVLFPDEAQHLTAMHYAWLIDLYNDLDEKGVDCSVILFGQSELYDIRNDFLTSGKDNIVGRFMAEAFELTGLRNVAAVEDCLKCYDDPEIIAYPLGSDWSYTRYFFPGAYGCGWRLQPLAQSIWDSFQTVKLRNGVPGNKLVIPTQAFTRVVEAILVGIGPRREASPRISSVELEGIVVAAGFGIGAQRASNDDEDENDAEDEQP